MIHLHQCELVSSFRQRFKAMSLWPLALPMSPFIFVSLCILHTDAPRVANLHLFEEDVEMSVGDPPDSAEEEEEQGEGGRECD